MTMNVFLAGSSQGNERGLDMSRHDSVVVIKGDRLMNHLTEIVGMFGYRDLGKNRIVRDDEEFAKMMDGWNLGDGRVLKAATTSAGWLMIYDPEFVMNVNAQACQAVSRKFSTQVFGMTLEGASDTFGFCLHDNGVKVREFLAVGGKLSKNDGKPLSPEIGLNLKGLSGLDEKLVTVMLGVTGVDLYTVIENGEFTVKELGPRGEAPQKAGGESGPAPEEKKSSWKFWT